MTDYVVMPLGIHVSKKMEISVVLPELVSLHELVHGEENGLTLSTKIDVLLELAKVLH